LGTNYQLPATSYIIPFGYQLNQSQFGSFATSYQLPATSYIIPFGYQLSALTPIPTILIQYAKNLPNSTIFA